MRHFQRKFVTALLPVLAAGGLIGARPQPRLIPYEGSGYAILVSLDERYLWLVYGHAVVMEAPVAIGISENFHYNGKKYDFSTPRGRRTVLKKERDPVWTVPEWHYFEKAAQQSLETVRLERGKEYPLGDGTSITIRGDQVGRMNWFGNFWAFTPGIEIIQYGKLYIPPLGTEQRTVPNALGPYKLDTGGGYLIHGTHVYTEGSIGQPASHGCVRMNNEDLERLYQLVDVGTPVYIY